MAPGVLYRKLELRTKGDTWIKLETERRFRSTTHEVVIWSCFVLITFINKSLSSYLTYNFHIFIHKYIQLHFLLFIHDWFCNKVILWLLNDLGMILFSLFSENFVECMLIIFFFFLHVNSLIIVYKIPVEWFWNFYY